MFPKQRCPVCQNRAWQGTTSAAVLYENTKLKEKIEDFKREIEFRDKQISDLEKELKELKDHKEILLREHNHGFQRSEYEYNSSRDDYYAGKHG
jgi:chromosome segregation ATPase